MLSSLRSRILILFLMSFLASGTALLYALNQFDIIGHGIFAIQHYYLPIADETTKLDIIVFQLQREQDRLMQPNADAADQQFLNAEFYIQELENSLQRTQGLIQLGQASNRINTSLNLQGLLDKSLQTQTQLLQYKSTWDAWKAKTSPTLTQNLEKEKSKLVVSIRQLSEMVSTQMQQVIQYTELSRQKSQKFAGTLALLATLLWVLFLFFALRVIRPLSELTTQVQRFKQGEAILLKEQGNALEVEVLYKEFNEMAEAVKERDQRLSERAEVQRSLSQRLQQAIDSIRMGLFVIESNRITMVNTSAQQMWNLQAGENVPTWLPNQSEPELHINGRVLQVAIQEFGTSGDIVVAEDITDQVKAREQLNQTQRLAMIGKMLAQITHEIRNPLNAMSLNAEMLAEEDLTESAREMVEILTLEIQRLEHSTSRYLDLSRQPTLSMQTIQPKQILQNLIQYEGWNIEFQTVGECPMLQMDEDILRRSFRNLLRNANEAGATIIQIQFVQDQTHLWIDIQDNGTGMNEEMGSNLFEPFITTKAQGTGLGLSICRQELELCQCTLEWLSHQRLTTFRIGIPLKHKND